MTLSEDNFDITGSIRDNLLGMGLYPSTDARLEYMAGGGPGFPLIGQINLSNACDDLTQDLGVDVYEVMLNDPTVASAFFVLATAILNGKFQVIPRFQLQPGEELAALKGSAREDIENSTWAANFIDFNIQRQPRPIKSTSFEMLYALAFGCKLAEKVFEEATFEGEDVVALKRLRTKQNKAWSYVVTPYGDLVGIRGVIVGGGIVDFPPDKFMIHTWMPQDGDPRGRSILRAAYNGWNLKINSWPKLYKYLDRFGSPIAVATLPENAPDEPLTNERGAPVGAPVPATQAMGNALARLEGGSWMVMRNGADFNLYAPTTNGEAFLHAIDIFKHEILEGILMTARATLEAEHGSKADTQEAHHVVARLIGLGRTSEEGMYEHQLFHHLLFLNRGKDFADRYTPHCSTGEVEAKDIEKVLTAFVGAGYVLDPGHYPFLDATFGLKPRKIKDGQAIIHPVQIPGDGADGLP